MKKRFISILLTIIMITGLIPTNTFAAAPIHVLALGDSITTGYGLTNAETECFTAILGNNYTVTTKAVNGNTMTGIAQQLQTGAIPTQMIAAADVITITAGGNDMMGLLYTKMAEIYNAENHSNIRGTDVSTLLGQLNQSNLMQNYALLGIAEQLLSKENATYFMQSQEFVNALAAYQQTLIETTLLLQQINPDAEIIVATQYNPYAEFHNHALFHFFYEGMEEGVSKLNEAITTGAAAGGYTVADVKAAFHENHSTTNDLYNANPDMDAINLDFHPNAAGHAVLAEVFKAAIEGNGDNSGSLIPNTDAFGEISSDAYYAEAIKWATKNGITSDTSDATCTRAQAITILWQAAGSPSPKNTEMTFIDVPVGSYYHDAVLWAVSENITFGTSATTFSPDATCNRAQLATFLYRFLNNK
ncbi:GDSL-type esterase/lipase family protein [Anaerotignum sp.]